MIKSAKKIINSKVFDAESGEEIGIVSDIGFCNGKIESFCIKSNSIVPLDLWLCPTSLKNRGKKIVAERLIGQAAPPLSFKRNIRNRAVLENNSRFGRGKDLLWNSKTGETTAISYRKNFLHKEKQISTNKTTISGENIIIEI